MALSERKKGLNVKEGSTSKSIPWLTLALVFFLGALLFGVGGTFAALTDAQKHDDLNAYPDGKLINKGEAIGEVEAYPGLAIDRTVVAKNEGKQEMYVRMQLSKVWVQKNSSGKWEKTTDTSLQTDFIEIVLDDTSSWIDGGDGWYYYKSSIKAGDQSTSLLKQVKLSDDIGEDQNDNWYHEVTTSSKYVGKAAQVAVTMQCTAEPIVHTVKVNTNGGTEIDDIVVEDGKIVKRPSDPVRAGYTFAGWYADEACTIPYDFDAPVTGDITLYAKWTKNPDPVDPDDPDDPDDPVDPVDPVDPTPSDSGNSTTNETVTPTVHLVEATSYGDDASTQTTANLVQTGDGFSTTTTILFALAAISLVGCLSAFFFAARRSREDEE